MENYKLNTIDEALEDFREGKFVIVVDDEDRENEGDLICAAEKITPEMVNFMLKNARGLLCAPITISRSQELDLPHQVQDNTSLLGTPFTVTIDKIEGCTTGVSAHDRAATIKALADPASTPQTFGRPGHINPLYAQDNGVLRRSGHTEAAIDLCKLSGLYPVGALMEIMNDDGTMARMPQLMEFAQKHQLKIASTGRKLDEYYNLETPEQMLEWLSRHEMQSEITDGAQIELKMQRDRFKKLEHSIYRSFSAPVVLYAFTELCSFETSNITHIIEGIRYGVDPSYIENNILIC